MNMRALFFTLALLFLSGCNSLTVPLTTSGYVSAAKLGGVEYFTEDELSDAQKAKLLENIKIVQGEFESYWGSFADLDVYLTNENGRDCTNDSDGNIVTPLGPRLNLPELYHEMAHQKLPGGDFDHTNKGWSSLWNIMNGTLQNRMD